MNERKMVKLAAVQMEPQLMEVERNLAKIREMAKIAASARAELIVFPECSLTGYMFSTREEATQLGECVPGNATEEVSSVCKSNNVYVVFGLIEKEGAMLFNTAALIGPQGLVGKYRKNHLPCLGVDRFLDAGNLPFKVFKTPLANIGIEICYDIMFPEVSRILALQGADILTLITNYSPLPWGRGDRISEYIIPARALENRVHVVAADRIGFERGFTFAGRSKIVDALGETLGEAENFQESIIYAEVGLAMARQKQSTVLEGEWEVNGVNDRRPELYGEITKRKSNADCKE